MSKLSSILLVDDDKITNFLNQLLLNDLGIAEQVQKMVRKLCVLFRSNARVAVAQASFYSM
jgi:hypothetical protein